MPKVVFTTPLALAVLTSPTILVAQATEPPSGSLIYLREVPVRPAHLPGQPGTPHYVDLESDKVIVPALDGAVRQITDSEAGAIVGAMPHHPMLDADARSQAPALGSLGNGSAQLAQTLSPQGGLMGKTIRDVGGAISGAMATLSNTLGERP